MAVKVKHTTAPISARVVVLKTCIQLLMLQITLVGNVSRGNVLIWPTEASYWLNIKVIIEELIHRNHNVSVLVPSGSLFIKPGDVPAAKFEVYPVPFGKDAIDSLIKDYITLWLSNRPTFHQFYQQLGTLVRKLNDLSRQMCEGVLANQELMAQLQRRKYDMLLSDPVTICGDLVALKLEIPFVYVLRFMPASVEGRRCGKISAPPSHVPAVLSELTDRLSFGEWVKNMISYHIQDYVFYSYWGEWDSYCSQVLGHSKTKAFITHGRTNRIYEAIYHGIPVVGIPMFIDQPDNIIHVKKKGTAVELNFHTTVKDLVDALKTVIHNPIFKENAVRLSQIHHDQPIKPLNRAVFWIEFVMRHKGAKHLRPAAHHLTWY